MKLFLYLLFFFSSLALAAGSPYWYKEIDLHNNSLWPVQLNLLDVDAKQVRTFPESNETITIASGKMAILSVLFNQNYPGTKSSGFKLQSASGASCNIEFKYFYIGPNADRHPGILFSQCSGDLQHLDKLKSSAMQTHVNLF